jgi:chaperonin cofactor prefoldin
MSTNEELEARIEVLERDLTRVTHAFAEFTTAIRTYIESKRDNL